MIDRIVEYNRFKNFYKGLLTGILISSIFWCIFWSMVINDIDIETGSDNKIEKVEKIIF